MPRAEIENVIEGQGISEEKHESSWSVNDDKAVFRPSKS